VIVCGGVDKRTWGGLVVILGFVVLMDGGAITARNFAIWTPEEGWVVENVGAPPDIEVEMSPAAVIAGHDPQIEKEVEVLMAERKKNPRLETRRYRPKFRRMPIRRAGRPRNRRATPGTRVRDRSIPA
jgi:C-terminal processing protease CtpA/Prc